MMYGLIADQVEKELLRYDGLFVIPYPIQFPFKGTPQIWDENPSYKTQCPNNCHDVTVSWLIRVGSAFLGWSEYFVCDSLSYSLTPSLMYGLIADQVEKELQE
ncbi:hypothetical protein AVEN_109551-1 [Araneus ventricosus]|uniref:Uncharacterized protein n=1 Tax=Araneus ventricosus TaxID=182803 RepID=A0A4Y2QZZ4_ARAVE|nr:hypothetical protein AVEN_109551-1 [Araneus ventricosus]